MDRPSIDIDELGTIQAMDDSPPGMQFWEGDFNIVEAGSPQPSRYFLVAGADESPSSELCVFAASMLEKIDDLIGSARALLRRKLESAPDVFGIEASEAQELLQRPDELLPFGMPEPTFYRPGQWQIRFAECPLPACEPFGVSVTFRDSKPDAIEGLADSEQIT